MTNERLQILWLAAMEGLSCSREDILDLIDEIKFLRITLDWAYPDLPPAPPTVEVLENGLVPDPWAEEFTGN